MLDHYLNLLEIRHKKVVVAVVALMLLVGSGVTKLSTSSDIRTYFNPNSIKVRQMEAMEAEFGVDHRILFVIAPKFGAVFDVNVLTLIESLTEDAWKIPNSRRVSSIQNHHIIESDADTIKVAPLYHHGDEVNVEDLDLLKERALSSKSLAGFLINKDASVTGIDVSLNINSDVPAAAQTSVSSARKLRDEYQALYPEVEIQLSGFTFQSVVFEETVKKEVRILFLICVSLIMALLVFLIRHFQWTLLTLLIILLSVLATEGLFGWTSGVLTPATGFVPGIIMILAIADCVHIFQAYALGLSEGQSKQNAIRYMLTANSRPIIVTSVCTMIGMLCLNFNESPPYHDLGNMVALGAFLAMCLSLSLLPAILYWMPAPKNIKKAVAFTDLNQFSSWVIANQKALLVMAFVSAVVFSYAISLNQISDNLNTYHKKDTQLRKTLDFIDENLTGTNTVHFVLESSHENGVLEREYLEALDKFASWLSKQKKVAHVLEISADLKNVNQKIQDDQVGSYALPKDAQSAAQLLLLYELSLPFGLSTDNLLSMDRSRSRVVVMLNDMDNNELIAFEMRANEWLSNHQVAFQLVSATGFHMTFAHIAKGILFSLVKGALSSVFLISIFLVIAMKSFKYGVLSLLPNILPAMIAYGLWGIFESKVGISVAFIFCMSLGIVVDDTIHFLSKYLYATRTLLFTPEEAVRYAFNTVGGALIITSLVLCSGFLVLMFSSFNPSADMGVLLAITMASALAVDFLFLPPLLLLVDGKGTNSASKQER